jgi:hypothetical protein
MNLGMAAPVLPNWKWGPSPKEYRAAASPIEAVSNRLSVLFVCDRFM